jgi:hypothetical protein
VIRQDPIVHELPSKGIRNYDNDAFCWRGFRFGNVSIEALDFGFTAQGQAGVDVAAETIWARHCVMKVTRSLEFE